MAGVRTLLKKGDEVVILSGRDRGRRGKIQRVLASEGKVIIEEIGRASCRERV